MHTATEDAEDPVESGPLLKFVIGNGSAILELLAGEE